MISEIWLNRSNDYAWLYSGLLNGNFVAFHIHDKRSKASIYTKAESYELEDILHIERETLADLVEHIEQVYSVKVCFRDAPDEIIARAHPSKLAIKERFGLDNESVPPVPSRRRMKENLQERIAFENAIFGDQMELTV